MKEKSRIPQGASPTDLQTAKHNLAQLYHNPYYSWIPTGYPALDNLTGGLVRGGLTVIGTRPAMGGTSFALNLASRLSRQMEGSIAIISPAHTNAEITIRLMQIGMDMDAGCLLDGSLSPAETANRCSDFFLSQKCNTKIFSVTQLTLDDIEWFCENIPDLCLVIVDSPECIQEPMLFYGDNVQLPTRVPMVKVIPELKNLARLFDVPVVCTVYMPRSMERRKNKRPRLEDLERVGVLPELADVALFLYRNDYYYFESDDPAECIVAKTCYGHTGTVLFRWDRNSGRFEEYES